MRTRFPNRIRESRLAALALLLLAGLTAIAPAAALGQTSASPLARYVPQRKNLLHFEFDGIKNHAAAWDRTSASKILTATPTGAMLESICSQLIHNLNNAGPGAAVPGQGQPAPPKPLGGPEITAMVKHVLNHGMTAGAWGEERKNSVYAIFRDVTATPETAKLFGTFVNSLQTNPGAPDLLKLSDGRQAVRSSPTTVWWVEKPDLVIVSGNPAVVLDFAEEIVGTAAGKSPSLASNAIRNELFRSSAEFEPIAAAFGDLTVLPPMPESAKNLGLDGIKRVEIQWGVQDNALLSKVRVVAPSPRRGILALLDQPGFDVNSMPAMPSAQKSFAVVSLDPAKTLDQILAIEQTAGSTSFKDTIAGFESSEKLDLRRSILSLLGPKTAFYVAPGGASTSMAPGANPLAQAFAMLSNPPRLTMVTEIKDAKAFTPSLAKLMDLTNRGLEQAAQSATTASSPDEAAKAWVGRSAPNFEMTVLETGNKTKKVSKADLAGKVVLLDFWTTWCPPCMQELPEIQKMVRTYEKSKKDVVIAAISEDVQEGAQPVRGLIEKTLKDNNLKFIGSTVSMVATDPSQSIGNAFKIAAYPTTMVMDGKGVIRSVHIGYSPDVRKKLTDDMDRLLAGRALAGEKPAAKSAAALLAFKFNRDAPSPTYILNVPPKISPIPLPSSLAPAVVLGKKHLALGINAKAAREALGLADGDEQDRWTPDGDFAPIAKRLPSKMVALSVGDSEQSIQILTTLPEILNGTLTAALSGQMAAQGGMPPGMIPGGGAPGANYPAGSSGGSPGSLPGATQPPGLYDTGSSVPGAGTDGGSGGSGGEAKSFKGRRGGPMLDPRTQPPGRGLVPAGGGPGPEGSGQAGDPQASFNQPGAINPNSGGSGGAFGGQPGQVPGAGNAPGMPGAVRLDVPAHLRPTAAQLEPLFFPSSTAVSTDEGGITITMRGAFPDAVTTSFTVALLLPAVQAARNAAQNAENANNLKQLGLAIHNYLDANKRLPAPAIMSAQNQPLLSWRVAILPYLGPEGQTLYQQFKLDEPWDGPTNRPLLEKMPQFFAGNGGGQPGHTPYLAVTGPGTLFDGSQVTLAGITDGTANTIMAVESKTASVPWTKPEDLTVAEGQSPPIGGFLVLMADGSIATLSPARSPADLRALITRSGGEAVQPR